MHAYPLCPTVHSSRLNGVRFTRETVAHAGGISGISTAIKGLHPYQRPLHYSIPLRQPSASKIQRNSSPLIVNTSDGEQAGVFCLVAAEIGCLVYVLTHTVSTLVNVSTEVLVGRIRGQHRAPGPRCSAQFFRSALRCGCAWRWPPGPAAKNSAPGRNLRGDENATSLERTLHCGRLQFEVEAAPIVRELARALASTTSAPSTNLIIHL
jgi:hypothetical protein